MSLDDLNIFEIDEHKKKLNDEQKRLKRREINDVKRILKTPEGRRFIWWIWSECGIFRNPFTSNANQTGYNSGRMSLGHQVLDNVNAADPTAFAQIQQEYMSALHSKKEAQDA